MLDLRYTAKGTPYVYATDLHTHLKIEGSFESWFARYARQFKKDRDYFRLHRDELFPDGRHVKGVDYAVQIYMAQHLIVSQEAQADKPVREELIQLSERAKNGELLSYEQMEALLEICEVLGYFSVQKQVERQHFDVFTETESKGRWAARRASLLGFSKQELEKAMTAVGKKYKSQRQAWFHIDRYELFRIATIDLFKHLGKSDEFARNAGKVVKMFAKRINPIIDNDVKGSIDFKPLRHHQTIQMIISGENKNRLLGRF